MDRMLINATEREELRVVLVKDDKLSDLDIERPGQKKRKANIYKARITRIEPSLEAAFVDYGPTRQGFLPLKEISPAYFQKPIPEDEERPNIKELLKEGQEFMVQVDKEERGSKGAALTTYIILAGCYLVLMANNPKAGGISRRIEGDERDELREVLQKLTIPEGMGVIIRTAGMGKNLEDLQWDLDVLLNQWEAIQKVSTERHAPFLIHEEGDVVTRSIRDNLRKDIDEIIIDNQEIFVKAKNYIQQVRPDFISRVKLYQDMVPLFSRYQIEAQIETAYQREVQLPSGGSIVIDRTEALVSIDINSARATGGGDIEETALNTNLEAADEIARQLRLRDLGGLIVIDFIDMSPIRNQRSVENRLREALRTDRARVQIGRISRFGLLEMSRQRLRSSLGEASQILCPRCSGRGTVRSIESLALSVIRLIEEDALKENTAQIQAQFPVEVATFILNEKRDAVTAIEKRHDVDVLIIPNPHFETPHYKITRVEGEGRSGQGKPKTSYQLIEEPEVTVHKSESGGRAHYDEPAIKGMAAGQSRTDQTGIMKRLWSALFGTPEEEPKKPAKKPTQHRKPRQQQHRRHRKPSQGGGRKRSPSSSDTRSSSGGGDRRSGGGSRSQRSGGGGKRRHPSQRHHHAKRSQHHDDKKSESKPSSAATVENEAANSDTDK